MPQWVPVVWIAAALDIFSTIIDLMDNDWSDYITLVSIIVEIVLWSAILSHLHKREAIKPVLLVIIILSLAMSLFSEMASLFLEDDYYVWLISFLVDCLSFIAIIPSYSGALRKYAIISLICVMGILSLSFLFVKYDLLDFSSVTSSKYIIIAIAGLIYLPYQALAKALTEGKDESQSGV